MHIEHEAGFAQRTRTQPGGIAQLETLEHRIHRHALATVQLVREVDRLAIDENQVDLRMRHAQRFDAVLDGRRAVERMGEGLLPAGRRQEVAQLFVEAEFAVAHCLGHGRTLARRGDDGRLRSLRPRL
jgi:hypothetical protein